MIHTGDAVEVMRTMPSESVDAIVTDPPAGVSFMSKKWDSNKGGRTQWVAWMTEVMVECHRLLKPGGYAVVWSLPRTCHWTAWAMEDAGFYITDQLAHIFASGFPKGRTQLKPAREDWWLARKPGPLRPLNIEETRIGTGDERIVRDFSKQKSTTGEQTYGEFPNRPEEGVWENTTGRWPSNLLLSDPELFDEPNPWVVGSGATTTDGTAVNRNRRHGEPMGNLVYGAMQIPGPEDVTFGGSGGYSRFFLVPKSSRADREPVLRDAAVRLHRESGECDKLGAWESEVRRPNEQTDSSSPEGDISDEPTMAGSSSATSSPGKPFTARSPRATKSTTSTATSKTTGSSTFSLLTPSPTSESTPGASSETVNGGSPAQSAESSSPLWPSTGTSPEKAGPSTVAAARATSGPLSKQRRCADCGKPLPRVGTHPTTKPTDLMRHLIRLVTPIGGVILDPFAGSGSTGVAATLEGFDFILIEQSVEYVAIAEARLNGTQRGLGLDVGAPTKVRKVIRDYEIGGNGKGSHYDRLGNTKPGVRFRGKPSDEEPAA